MWGEMKIETNGIRASYAYPACLVSNSELFFFSEHRASSLCLEWEGAAVLAARYGIPSADTLEEAYSKAQRQYAQRREVAYLNEDR